MLVTVSPSSLPPERLGVLLKGARRDAQLSRRRAAKFAGITPAQLTAIERGWDRVDGSTFDLLLDAYGTTVARLIAPRSQLAVIDNVLHTGSDVHVAASTARDDVLRSYLALLRNARRDAKIDTLALRADDLTVLASVLDTDEATLITRISTLLDCDRSEATSLAKLLLRVAAPALGAAIGIATLSGSTAPSGATAAPVRQITTPAVTAVAPIVSPAPSAVVTVTAPESLVPVEHTVVTIAAPPIAHPGPSTPSNHSATESANEPAHATANKTLSSATTTPPPLEHDASSNLAAPPTHDIGAMPSETPTKIFYGG